MKVILALVLAVAAVTGKSYPKTACGKGPSHNLILGNRTYGDKLLYSGDEHLDSAILRKQSKDFTWPLQGTQREMISMVEVTDKMKDGTGGCAFLTSGGPGSHSVKLHLKTQRGEGLNFHISIYGK